MNLLPESYIRRQFRNRVDLACIIIFALIMVGVILVDRTTRTGFDKAHQQYTIATAMSERASGLTGEFFALQRTKDTMIAEAKWAMEMEECIPRSYLLGVITNSLPETVSLTKIQLQTQIPIIPKGKKDFLAGGANNSMQRKSSADGTDIDDTPTEKPKPIVTVTLEGVSVSENDYDIANLIRILKEKQLSKKVTLLYARQQKSRKSSDVPKEKQQKLREFGICMELLNDVDVRELIKSGSRRAETNRPAEGAIK